MPEFQLDDLMFRPGLMKGQRILITGGGTGLGKVMAEACALLGADVVIWGRRGNIVEATAKELSRSGSDLPDHAAWWHCSGRAASFCEGALLARARRDIERDRSG